MKNWHTMTKEELFNEVVPGVMFSKDIFMQEFHLMNDRWPEPDEIADHIKQPYSQKTKDALVQLTMSHTSETWSEFEKQMIDNLGLEVE